MRAMSRAVRGGAPPEREAGGAGGGAAIPGAAGEAGFGGYIPFSRLARAWGAPPVEAVLRRAPGDFVVEEELGFEPEGGDGSHLWLLVRKTGCTTPFAARLLARRFGAPVRDVGFAGLKDRHAVTSQWFSVPLPPGAPLPEPGPLGGGDVDGEAGVEVVRALRGRKKLRRGAHAGNRFTIALRDARGDRAAFAARVERVARAGAPNYFGAQRFGRGGGNVDAAARMLRGEPPAPGERPPGRQLRGLYLSAARSLLFNRVLHCRVEHGEWNVRLPGDAVLIEGRQRALAPDAAPREGGTAGEWVAALRAHPSGPLWGRGSGACEVARRALAVEEAALAGCAGWRAGLEAAGVEAARRALRVVPSDFEWEEREAEEGGSAEGPADAGSLVVRFRLPRGAYATAVLRELAGEAPAA